MIITNCEIFRDTCMPTFTILQYSLFGSILTVGAMVGAIMSGRVADIIGRKRAMEFSDIFCIMGWLAIIFGKDSWWLDLGRLSIGYVIGQLSYVVPIYIAEITPKNIRGAFTTVNKLMICSGASLAWVLGTVSSWRALAIIGAALCILQLFGLLIIPDSPRWLAKNGQDDEFILALQTLRGKDYDIFEESEEIQVLIAVFFTLVFTGYNFCGFYLQEFTKTLESLPQGRMLDLIQKRYLRFVTSINRCNMREIPRWSSQFFFLTTQIEADLWSLLCFLQIHLHSSQSLSSLPLPSLSAMLRYLSLLTVVPTRTLASYLQL